MQRRMDYSKIEQGHCPHHLHGRLKVYTRPVRRLFRKDIFLICVGCGKRI